MGFEEVLDALRAAGTAQNRKVYARHGVRREMFGVSYAELGRLKKRIGTDHDLAKRLWATGNHDARILATMVADPAAMKAADLEAWAKDLDSYVVTDAFSGLVAKSPHAPAKLAKWTRAKGEWIGAAGWNLVGSLALSADDVPDSVLVEMLRTIETEIHGRRNRVRHSMNMALIAIGGRNATLEKKAVAAANRIGRVEVDHGETGCQTPEAIPYIRRMRERARARRAAGKPAGKASLRARAARKSGSKRP